MLEQRYLWKNDCVLRYPVYCSPDTVYCSRSSSYYHKWPDIWFTTYTHIIWAHVELSVLCKIPLSLIMISTHSQISVQWTQLRMECTHFIQSSLFSRLIMIVCPNSTSINAVISAYPWKFQVLLMVSSSSNWDLSRFQYGQTALLTETYYWQ